MSAQPSGVSSGSGPVSGPSVSGPFGSSSSSSAAVSMSGGRLASFSAPVMAASSAGASLSPGRPSVPVSPPANDLGPLVRRYGPSLLRPKSTNTLHVTSLATPPFSRTGRPRRPTSYGTTTSNRLSPSTQVT